MSRQVFFLDLRNQSLAEEYADNHLPGNVPRDVIADIIAAGIRDMQIFMLGDRLAMITEASAGADTDARVTSDASVEWERRMDLLQRPLPGEPAEAKWKPGKLIFNLHDHYSKDI